MKNKFFGIFLMCGASVFAADNYSSWGSFKTIVVDTRNQAGGAKVATAQTGFPLLVRLNSANAADIFSGSKVANGGDIRFAQGATHLSYQRERWDAVNDLAEFWVLVPAIKGSDTTQLQIYWNKAGVNDSSSGPAVFNAANNFRAVWHFAETASPSADATPNGLSAAWQNNPASTTGMIANAINLPNGTGATGLAGNFLTVPDVAGGLDMSGTAGVTLSFWMKRAGNNSGNTSVQMMAGRYNYSDLQMQFGLVTNAAGLLTLYYAPTGDGDMTLATTTTVANGTWYHVTATLTSTSQTVYVNGVQKAASATAMTSLDQVYADPFTVGVMDYMAPYSQYYNGALDEMQYSATARSADWIKLTYQTQRSDSLCVTLGATVYLPPANLTYAPNPAVYTVGYAIPNNSPTVTGNVSTYSVSPALPPGLSLNTTTGVISGTPTAAEAAANYTVTATNSGGSTTVQLNITVNAALVAPTGLAYSPNPAVYGLNIPIAANTPTVTGTVTGYAVSPGLPAGLSFNATTGVISGTPTSASAAANYTVTASNSAGNTVVTVNLAVLAAPSGLSYSAPTANYPKSQAIPSNTPTVTGTVAAYTISPALPVGISINAATGVISGTPTIAAAAATYTVTAANVAGSTTAILNITVYGPPSGLAYASNPVAYSPNQPILANPVSVTGTVIKYTVSPALPAGLMLDSVAGTITGTPTVSNGGYLNYTVTASNPAGSTTVVVAIWVTGSSAIMPQQSSSFVIRNSGISSMSFLIPAGAQRVQISILDMGGRTVWSRTVEAGNADGINRITWDGIGADGLRVSPGLYGVSMKTWGSGVSNPVMERRINLDP